MVLVLLTSLVPASARGAPIAVATEGCDTLHASEIERILGIELADVAERWGGAEPLRVELACEGSRVHATAIDPVTDKRLSRDVALARVKDRDRVMALLVSQLFLTSWSELLLRPEPEVVPVLPPPPAPAVVRAAEGLARTRTAPSPTRFFVTVAGGPRIREPKAPIVGARVAARPGLILDERWILSLELGYERGAADRASGTVAYGVASGALGAGLRAARAGPLVLEVAAHAGLAYLDAHGDAQAPAVGSSASGVVSEMWLSAGPTLELGPTFGLEVALGLTAPRATAHVARDNDVTLGGPWAGVNLVIGLEGAR